MTTLLLALALATTAADPISGSPLYQPAIGEAAVIHRYNEDTGSVATVVDAWTDATVLAEFHEALDSEANQAERIKVLGDAKALKELCDRQEHELAKGSIERGELLGLPDMTPVRVRALASFQVPPTGAKLPFSIVPFHALVEVTDGPGKGRFFWVSRFSVRVPGSEIPEMPKTVDSRPKPRPARRR